MDIGGAQGDMRVRRVLGHPIAYIATTLVLVTLFGWTFFANPGRAAPADDPAYTLWRTEALLVEAPEVVMGIEGPDGMLSTGYRITTPVVTGLMRRLLGVQALTPTIVLAVGCRVVIALLLAGLAYRQLRDPLAWHTVALGSGSVLLTPVFGGYTDNMIALSFVTGALYLMEPMRTRWDARIAFTGLLTMAGLTHPTTFMIFCGVLGVLVILRAIFDRRRDLFELFGAAIAAATVLAVWNIGIWGPAVELEEAALPPPANVAFFRARLDDWLASIGIPSALLFACGAAGLYLSRRDRRDLFRLAVAWLVPLVGVLGAVTSFAYPYYRFLNATLAWVLLLGLGAYFVVGHAWPKRWIGALAGVAVALAIGSNFWNGVTSREWNDPTHASITPQEKRDLDALSSFLRNVSADRVIFVVDDDTRTGVRLYGFLKRAANVTRYGVPPELQDRTSIYLGSSLSLLQGRPAGPGDYHEALSATTLEEIGPIDDDDIIVAPALFNQTGTRYFLLTSDVEHILDRPVHSVGDGRVFDESGLPVSGTAPLMGEPSGWWRVAMGALVLLLPGFLLTRVLLPESGMADAGFALAIAVALVAGVTIVGLAIARQPLSSTVAWTSLATSTGIATAVALTRRRRAGER